MDGYDVLVLDIFILRNPFPACDSMNLSVLTTLINDIFSGVEVLQHTLFFITIRSIKLAFLVEITEALCARQPDCQTLVARMPSGSCN